MTTQSDTYSITALQQLGLSEHEARVYHACLKRGELTLIELAKATNISRTTIYGITDKLVSKGLLRFIQKGAHRVYSSENPKHLQAMLDHAKDILDKRKAFLQSILPTLAMQFTEGENKPLVSYYQGQGEVRQLFDNFLQSGAQEACFIGEASTLEGAIGHKFLTDFVKQRINLGIKTRGIRTETTEVNEPLYGSKSKYLRKVRLAPPKFKCPTYIVLYENTVFFVSSIVESYGVLVESKDLYDSLLSWFDVLWSASTEI